MISPGLAGEFRMTEESRPVGRPSKYDPAFCDAVIACMGKGYSLTAFAGEIGVARSTINEWMAEHAEFSEACRVGQAKRTRALETTLLAGESGPKVTGHIFALKNADPDGWKDKQEHALGGLDGAPIKSEAALTVTFVRPGERRDT